jgi:osomolarity two-component system response regulator SSK1
MDIQMPVMDGIEATRQIRQLEAQAVGIPDMTYSPGNKSTPLRSPGFRSSVIIVALTASSLQSDRVNALAAGCNDFLTKPVSLVWLNNKIIEWGSLKALQMYAAVAPATPSANSDLTVQPDALHSRDEKSIEAKPTDSSTPHQGLPVPSRTSDSGAQPSNGIAKLYLIFVLTNDVTGALHNRRASHGSASSEEDNSLGSFPILMHLRANLIEC